MPIIAIDGPAGAGKSTAARWLAYQLGFTLVDTGALYRCLAYHAMERGLDLKNGMALADLCSTLRFSFGNLQKGTNEDPVPKLSVYCSEIEMTDSIRTPEMGMAASNISKLPEVRAALLQVQREFGRQGGIVMEGRDIGTVIFPSAEIKFYLSATVESRSKRRCEELNAARPDHPISMEQVIRETKARDEQDMNRPIAPLRQAEDAILIDSTSRSLEEVVNEMARHVRDWLKSTHEASV